MGVQSLVFQHTVFDIVDHKNQPWLRSFQIGSALGYKNPSADIAKLYDRNSDEFTADMTALVELDTAGGKQQTRIFSPRGCYALGMFARTAIAKDFRKWVLDVLEGKAETPQQKTKPKTLPNGLTTEQQEAIKALVKARVDVLPEEKRAKAAVACWSSLKSKFGMTYKAIQPDQFTDAISLVARLSLEGELLPKETPLSPVTKVNWPASRWLAESTPRVRDTMTLMQGAGTLMVSPEMLFGPPDEFISPTLKAIAELERLGHNLEACRLEVLAMKHHLEGAHHLFEGVRLWAEQTKGRGVRFKIQS